MNYSGVVYIFDLDDTLFWTSDWYEEARINIRGHIYHPGESLNLLNALKIFKKISINPEVPFEFKSLKLKMQRKFQTDGRDVYFEVVNSNDIPVSISDLETFLSKEQLNYAGIRTIKSISPFAIIAHDDRFYLNPNTIAARGTNEDIFNIYKGNHNNAVILTARKDVFGMKERISSLLSEYPPLNIYTQPTESVNSGIYKGKIITSIASQPDVSKIHFYDDSPKYIEKVQEEILNFDINSKTNISEKINIINVSADEKPLNRLKLAYAYANIFNRNSLLYGTNISNKYLRRLYGE